MAGTMESSEMIREFAQKSRLYSLLHDIDVELYEQTKEAGCPHCVDQKDDAGRLDDAFYERKPRGGPDDLPDQLRLRRSLCCSREGCRRRTLPPSCLYLGRKVYWRLVILVVLVCRQRRCESVSYRKLTALLGVSRSTVWRWMELYAARFAGSEEWTERQGLIGGEVGDSTVFASVWKSFRAHQDDRDEAMVAMVRFFAVRPSDFVRDG
jgi:hypothetical protein